MTINDALALHHAGRLAEAEAAYRQILAAQPNQYHALHFLGVLRAQCGDMKGSAELITRSLKLFAQNPLAEFHLAEALRKLAHLDAAADHFRRTLALDPTFVPAATGLVGYLLERGKPAKALAVCDNALQHQPDDAALNAARGDTLLLLERRADALAAYEKALATDPANQSAAIGLARLRFEQGDTEEAFTALAATIAAHPDATEPLLAQAILLGDQGRRDEALALYQRALALDPANADTYYNMGCLFSDCGNFEAARAAFDSALAINPRMVQALYNRAHTLEHLGFSDQALADSDAALALDPESGLAAGKSFSARMRRCDWSGRDRRLKELERLTRAGKKVDPYALAMAFDDPALHLMAAKNWALPAAAPIPPRPIALGRLRIAYISPNFHDHPVANLTVEMFEAHDRSRFETFGFCVAPGREAPIRQRLRGAFEHFVEAGHAADYELAAMLVRHGIDIAVDLAGYTAEGRTAALRYRPCPIAVGWLGFPGTTGVPYIDYIIADPVIIPPELEGFYSEKVVRLPFSYLPRDNAILRAPCPSRAALGLPEDAFVFSGFNNANKFTPQTFEVWMRLLKAVPGSVLWLNSQDAQVRANLCREASARGVAPERIVFAARAEARADHLARLACADLFLDTFPYGAHSTASDFLWAGVPVLTVIGRSFAARVAPALLTALDLGELIAADLAAYEEAALALARDPARLAALRNRLAETSPKAPLFDPVRFCRSLESAYESMADRHAKGQQPASFSVILPVV